MKINWWRDGPIMLLPVVGGMIGYWMDRKEDQRMSRFRDKSALFGRVLAPGQNPSW